VIGDVQSAVTNRCVGKRRSVAPSGEVVAVNDALQAEPVLVNQSPYEKGWMVRLRLDDPADLETLLSAADYEKLLGAHA